MRLIFASLLVLTLSWLTFGQTTKPVINPKAGVVAGPSLTSQEVIVEKNNGEKIRCLFVGGDTSSITVETTHGKQNVPLSEITNLRIGGTLTVIETPSAVESSGSADPLIGNWKVTVIGATRGGGKLDLMITKADGFYSGMIGNSDGRRDEVRFITSGDAITFNYQSGTPKNSLQVIFSGKLENNMISGYLLRNSNGETATAAFTATKQ